MAMSNDFAAGIDCVGCAVNGAGGHSFREVVGVSSDANKIGCGPASVDATPKLALELDFALLNVAACCFSLIKGSAHAGQGDCSQDSENRDNREQFKQAQRFASRNCTVHR